MRVLWILCWVGILGVSQSLDERLASLETLTPQERVALMNHIKEELMEMNQQDRLASIEKLRAKFHPEEQHHTVEEEHVSVEHMEAHHALSLEAEHHDLQTHTNVHRSEIKNEELTHAPHQEERPHE